MALEHSFLFGDGKYAPWRIATAGYEGTGRRIYVSACFSGHLLDIDNTYNNITVESVTQGFRRGTVTGMEAFTELRSKAIKLAQEEYDGYHFRVVD